jgi:hypothetical protein
VAGDAVVRAPEIVLGEPGGDGAAAARGKLSLEFTADRTTIPGASILRIREFDLQKVFREKAAAARALKVTPPEPPQDLRPDEIEKAQEIARLATLYRDAGDMARDATGGDNQKFVDAMRNWDKSTDALTEYIKNKCLSKEQLDRILPAVNALLKHDRVRLAFVPEINKIVVGLQDKGTGDRGSYANGVLFPVSDRCI